MNKLHIHERICTSCSERVHKYVLWCSQHLSNIHPCTCMVLTTLVEMHAYSPQKIHMHSCMRAYVTAPGAEASLPWKLLRTYFEYCASIVQAFGVTCPLAFSTKPVPNAVRSRNPSKSTLAHDVVAAAVSHKHHSIIRVGAGLIQFVYGSQVKRGHRAHPSQRSIFPFFSRSFQNCHGWGRYRPRLGPTRWVKTVYNICGLACLLGLTSPHKQVSLTTKRCGA